MKAGIKKLDLQGLVTLALLVAMNVVLQKISFGPATVKVGLGFIGSALLAYYFGTYYLKKRLHLQIHYYYQYNLYFPE